MAEIIYECCRDCRLLDICDPNYNSEPPCFQKAVESQTTAVQQLQAKIRAIADGLEIAYRGADPMAVDNAVNELRELSAVQ